MSADFQERLTIKTPQEQKLPDFRILFSGVVSVSITGAGGDEPGKLELHRHPLMFAV